MNKTDADIPANLSYDDMFRNYMTAKGLKPSDLPLTDSETREIVRMYRSGDTKLMSEAIDRMYMGLKFFITQQIFRCGKQFIESHPDGVDELESECFLAIVSGMPAYDPDRSKPTTFFNRYIIGAISGYVSKELNHNPKRYQNEIMKIVNDAINSLNMRGIHWTMSELAIETGLSIRSIENALVMINIKETESIDLMAEELEYIEDKSDGTEKQAMDNVMKETLIQAVNTLDRLERDCVLLVYGMDGFGDKRSVRQVTDILKHKGYPDISPGRVDYCLRKGLSKLRNCALLRDACPAAISDCKKPDTAKFGFSGPCSCQNIADLLEAAEMEEEPDRITFGLL